MTARTKHDLRCFCSRSPKIAVYGVTEEGDAYLHVKVYKQGRVFGEVVVTQGIVDLCCRECLRWTKVTVGRAIVNVAPDEPKPRVLARV